MSFMHLVGSPIRELHKHVGKPGMLSFAAGYPDSSLFDVEGLQSAAARAFQDSSKCLQYTATEELPVLRTELLGLMMRRGVQCLCASPWTQATAAEYISGGNFARRIPAIARAYAAKCGQLCAALTARFKDEISFDAPDGGMFLWARFPGRNASELLERALAHNVMFVPGHAFFHDNVDLSSLRLSYAGCSADEIVEGVRRLHRAAARGFKSTGRASGLTSGELKCNSSTSVPSSPAPPKA